jgi:putative membrane protein
MRLHPLSAVTRSLQRGLIAASFVFFAAGMASVAFPDVTERSGLLFALMPVAFLVGVGYQVAYYYRFDYRLTPDTLDIASGVVGRKEREIPYRRVQNVDITEQVLYRILGVAVVRVETAGGSRTEAVLNFVAAEEARRLQREIRERRAAALGETRTAAEADTGAETDAGTAPAADDGESPGEPTPGGLEQGPAGSATTPGPSGAGARPSAIFELGVAELLVYSVTAFRPASVFVLLLGFPVVEDVLLSTVSRLVGVDVAVEGITSTPDIALVVALFAIAVAVLASWMLSAVFTFTEYYDFELGRQGEDLVYERGLLQRYSGSIPTEKVQTVTITENVLMRALGYAGLAVETAGYSPGQSNQGGAQAAIPLAERDRTLSLARDLAPFGDPSFTRPPKRARRRYAARYTIAIAALTGAFALAALVFEGFTLWWSPLVLLAVAPVAAHLKWRHRGYAAGDDHFVVRSGFWTRTTRIVPYYRLQTVLRTRSVFQRRLGLAHLTADTATASLLGRRDATAYDIDAAEAARLFDHNRKRLQASLGIRS